MSSFLDEQAEEKEVLQSIFPTEYEEIDATTIKVKQLAPVADEVHVQVALVVTYPPAYPSVVPSIVVEAEKGLGKKQVEELQQLADDTAAANVGMPSIFVVAEALKEWLADNNKPGQDGSMYAEMMRRMQQKDAVEKKKADRAAVGAAADSEMKADIVDPEEQERIRKRQAGTQVTLESFIEWKTKFDAEMKALAEQGKKVVVVDVDERPTGKQLFLQNKVKDDDENALVAAGEEEEIVVDEDVGGEEVVDDDEDDDDEDDEDYVPGDEEDDDDDEEADVEEDSKLKSGGSHPPTKR